ncbi:hypothetical protein FB45DRAFT_1034431 [Roridomyces roridus]|uniref:Uncharacterized protein n=1 Tax=Roridomyces roridus TaxID=1738132 RepID=A0AAD7BCR0_9AGAR|nr:hypothetical protein FB45DRAFT_1034431 [Roridomyces roridus]
MKFSTAFSTSVVLALAQYALGQVSFVVSTGTGSPTCVPGTAIGPCTQATINAHACKGNFSPGQRCLHVGETHPNCHISVYAQPNQQGGVVQRISTASEGTIEASGDDAAWLSYGVFCP